MILKPPIVIWGCDKCSVTVGKPRGVNTQEFHSCLGMGGLSMPMVEDGKKVKVTVNEREDYVRGESVQVDGVGRPVMSITTEREDGIDCAVYAPVASIQKA